MKMIGQGKYDYRAFLLKKLDNLCNEFLNCIRDGYVSCMTSLEKSNDAERLMKFLDFDLSVLGISNEFSVMTYKQLQDSLRRHDDMDRNKAVKFLIDNILGESVSLKYIDEFGEIYNDSQLDRNKTTDKADTLRFLTILMTRVIWSRAVLRDMR